MRNPEFSEKFKTELDILINKKLKSNFWPQTPNPPKKNANEFDFFNELRSKFIQK